MDLYGVLFRTLLYPVWETKLHRRPTIARLDFLSRTQWRSPEELAEIQAGVLHRAGRALGRELRTLEDLSRLPIMDRGEARAFASSQKEDAEAISWQKALRFRAYEWAGYRYGDRALRRTARVEPTDRDVERIAREITKASPKVIFCDPRAGADLARFLALRGDHGSRATAVCIGETARERDRAALERAFGNVFESIEGPGGTFVAAECEAHDGLHVSVEAAAVEIVVAIDHTYRLAREGEPGDIVVSELAGASPIFRAHTGLRGVRLPAVRCACGRGLPRVRLLREGDASDAEALAQRARQEARPA